MADFEGELKTIMKNLHTPEGTQDWMKAQGYLTVASIHNWCNSAEQVETRIHEHSPAKDVPAVGASLKQTWRVCESCNTAALNNLAKGVPSTSSDEPLDDTVQLEVNASFLAYYNWPCIDVDKMGCDSLLGRIRREFESRNPTMISICRQKRSPVCS